MKTIEDPKSWNQELSSVELGTTDASSLIAQAGNRKHCLGIFHCLVQRFIDFIEI